MKQETRIEALKRRIKVNGFLGDRPEYDYKQRSSLLPYPAPSGIPERHAGDPDFRFADCDSRDRKARAYWERTYSEQYGGQEMR